MPSVGIKDRPRVVEDYEHRRGGKDGPQRCQILGIFDPRPDDL